MPADANRPFGPTAMPERGVMLIVDDDAINCAILETIFSPYYATATAPDGHQLRGHSGIAYGKPAVRL